jgi:hypothetical protein
VPKERANDEFHGYSCNRGATVGDRLAGRAGLHEALPLRASLRALVPSRDCHEKICLFYSNDQSL